MQDLYNELVDDMGIIHNMPILENMAWLSIEELPINTMLNDELTMLIKEVLDYGQ